MNKALTLTILLLVGCGQSHNSVTHKEACNITQLPEGTLIVCGDKESLIVNGQDGLDGTNGEDGSDGLDGITPDISYVTVCPDVSGQYPEVLIKLGSQYLAFLSSSNHMRQRLVLLEEGVLYQTTDDRGVLFQILEGELVCL